MRPFICLTSLLLCSVAFASAAEDPLREGDVFYLALTGPAPEFTADFERQYIVAAGVVTLPTLGKIPAAGLTKPELANLPFESREDDLVWSNRPQARDATWSACSLLPPLDGIAGGITARIAKRVHDPDARPIQPWKLPMKRPAKNIVAACVFSTPKGSR